MRFMIMVKASQESEAGVMPSRELVAAMGRFNQEMVDAGVMLAGDGLHPSSNGVRIRWTATGRTVTDGPFPETKELLAGFWIIQAKSREEAIAWASRAPFGEGAEVEVRPFFEATDFPADVLPPEEAAREQALRDRLRHGNAAR